MTIKPTAFLLTLALLGFATAGQAFSDDQKHHHQNDQNWWNNSHHDQKKWEKKHHSDDWNRSQGRANSRSGDDYRWGGRGWGGNRAYRVPNEPYYGGRHGH